MKIALCQYLASADIDSNLRRVTEVLGSCKADLAVFPEMFLTSYGGTLDREGYDRCVAVMRRAAEESGTDLCIGLPFPDGGRTYNRLLYLSSAGEIYHYDKMHIAAFPPYNEDFDRGRDITAVKGKDTVIGLSVCYDVMFPELYKGYSLDHGAGLMIVAAASKEGSRRYMETVLPARQLENTAYVVFVNNVGDGFFGGTRAYSPLGEPIRSLGAEEGMLLVDIDPQEIERARTVRPHLRDSTY